MPPKRISKLKPTVAKLGASTIVQPATASQKRFNPLTAFKLPSSSQEPPPKNPKGKEKALDIGIIVEGDAEDRLWVDLYEPTAEAELAVHIKKVEDVRRWFTEAFEGGPSGKLRRYRRILVLTGSSGAGKTTTVRVLSRELGFEILEWRNAIGETSSWGSSYDDPNDYESTFTKFEAFLNRATSCRSLFPDSEPSSSNTFSPRLTQSKAKDSNSQSKHVVLLEDLPNILHAQTQIQFHSALRSFIDSTSTSTSSNPIPIVIILSDATMRGETRDEILSSGGGKGWGKDKSDILDIRTVLPKDLLGGPYVTQIAFNPIAPTLMKKALTSLVDQHFSSSSTSSSSYSQSQLSKISQTQSRHSQTLKSNPRIKDLIDSTIESANGDIRSAITTLQFSYTSLDALDNSNNKIRNVRSSKKGAKRSVLLEASTKRESSLALFHLMGKVLYNKRKGDPSSSSATAKDLRKEAELDEQLKDPPKLPSFLKVHERRTSRVDVDTLYADSPIDSSLFSLYIHQNYTQFCNELDETEGVIDWLSWIDSSGGEAWYQANPHCFHLLTLGTLHSLPSPVQRRSQKVYKPNYFENLVKEKEAWEAVGDIRYCLMLNESSMSPEIMTPATSRWSKLEVALELGAVLKLKSQTQVAGYNKQTQSSASTLRGERIPASHQLFSRMVFTKGGKNGKQVDEGDTFGGNEHLNQLFVHEDEIGVDSASAFTSMKGVGMGLREEEGVVGGWLEEDDIEEF